MTGGFSPFPVDEDGYENCDSNAHFEGVARVKGPKLLQLPVLTIGLLGVQILWSVEMSYGECFHPSCRVRRVSEESVAASPYLLSLGLSKSGVAMVFVAGPLSGLIVQPLIGTLSRCSAGYGALMLEFRCSC